MCVFVESLAGTDLTAPRLSVAFRVRRTPAPITDVMAQAEMVYRMASAAAEETTDRVALSERFMRLDTLVADSGESGSHVWQVSQEKQP